MRLVTHVAFSPNGQYGLVCGNGPQFGDAELQLWDLENGELVREFAGHTENVRAAIF
jgi:hypothetical protein